MPAKGESSEVPAEKTYSPNVLSNTLGVSRGTLRYYEQIKLVRPERDSDSNYRVYSNSDVFRVVECQMLKNAGFQVQQAKDFLAGSHHHDASSIVQMVVEGAAFRREWSQAMYERSTSFARVIAGENDRPRLVYADEWLIYYDGAERGYDNFKSSQTQDALLEGMPISSFAAVLHGDVTDPSGIQTRWGRAVPTRYLHLLPDLEKTDEAPGTLGSCPCVAIGYSADERRIPSFREDGAEVCGLLDRFIKETGLRQSGPLFSPDVLPARGRVYSNIYVPVEPRTAAGHMRIAALRRHSRPKHS